MIGVLCSCTPALLHISDPIHFYQSIELAGPVITFVGESVARLSSTPRPPPRRHVSPVMALAGVGPLPTFTV